MGEVNGSFTWRELSSRETPPAADDRKLERVRLIVKIEPRAAPYAGDPVRWMFPYCVFFAVSTPSPAGALLSVVAPAVSTGRVAISVGVILSRVR
jgi:hypothetical protein